jgi:CheY-like chemotaxis protein
MHYAETKSRLPGESPLWTQPGNGTVTLAPTGQPVLIVEDDDEIRASLVLLLRDEGYVVNEARDGIQALSLLAEMGDRCVIFLDMLMPRMDGIEVCERMVAGPMPRHDHAVILMSAWFHHSALANTVVSARLDKPFEIETVLELANRYSTAPLRH